MRYWIGSLVVGISLAWAAGPLQAAEPQLDQAQQLLLQKAQALDAAHGSEEAFEVYLRLINGLWYSGRPEAARAQMKALEGRPRPAKADLKVLFYQTRARLASDTSLAAQNLQEAANTAPTADEKAAIYDDLFEKYLNAGEVARARSALDRARELARYSQNSRLRKGLLMSQHELLFKEEKYEDAEMCLQSLIGSAQERKDSREEARYWLALSRDMGERGLAEEHDRCSRKAYDLSKLAGDGSGQLWALSNSIASKLSPESRKWRRELLEELWKNEPSPTQKSVIRERLADFYIADGDLALAEAAYRESLQAPGREAYRGVARNNLVFLLERQGKYEEALEQSRQILTLTGHSPARISMVRGLVVNLCTLGRYEEAKELLRDELRGSVTLTERADLVDSQVFWAQRERDFSGYLSSLKELLEIFTQLPDKEQQEFGERIPSRLMLLGGRDPGAAKPVLARYEQSLRTLIQNEKRPRALALVRRNLADYLKFTGAKSESIELLRENLELARASQEIEGFRRAVIDLTRALDVKKDYHEIEALSDEALARQENSVLISDRVGLYVRNEEWEKARPWALRLLENEKREGTRGVPRVQSELAKIESHTGHLQAALDLYRQAAQNPSSGPEIVRDAHLRSSEILRKRGDLAGEVRESSLAYQASQKGHDPFALAEAALARAASLESQRQDPIPLLAEAGERVRQLLQEVPAQMQAGLRARQPSIDHLYATWADKLTHANRPEEALAVLSQGRSAEVLQQWKTLNVTSRDPQVRGLLGRLEKLSQSLQSESSPHRAASVRQAFLSTVNELRQRDPLIANQVTMRATQLKMLQARLSADQRLIQYYSTPHALYIFIIGPQTLELRNLALESTRLAALVRRMRELVGSPNPNQQELRAVNDSLYETLVQPLGEALTAHHLLISPSGPLWYLPFVALQDTKGKYLGESCCLSYLATGDLLKLMDGTFEQPGVGSPLVLEAPPDAGLPATATELAELRHLYPATRTAHTRQELLQHAGDLSLLHIASHAKALPQTPNDSYVLLPDGRFSLAEIYGMSLARGSLVVLSTCDGGLGELDPGPEPASLATAFSSAGASSVVSSLWEVDDQATALLFKEFYGQLHKGVSRSEALQRAQAACKAKFPQPYYWAAFTLLGNPR